ETLDVNLKTPAASADSDKTEDPFSLDTVDFDDLDLDQAGGEKEKPDGDQTGDLTDLGLDGEPGQETEPLLEEDTSPAPDFHTTPRMIFRWQASGMGLGKVRWGLDIGTHTIKLVGVRKWFNSWQLNYVCLVEIAPGINVSLMDEASKQDAVEKAVGLAIKGKKNISKETVHSSIGNTSAVIRQIQYPQAVKDKLLTALQWEVRKYIPYEPDEVLVDAQILSAKEGEKMMTVLLGAVPKEHISMHMESLAKFSIAPRTVTADSIAVIDAISNDTNDSPSVQPQILVIDVGFRSTSLCFYRSDGGFFTLSLSIGGDRITQQLAALTGITYAQAEDLKCGRMVEDIELKPDDALTYLMQVYEQLYLEINKSIAFYKRQAGSGKLDRIYLCGGGAFLRELAPFLNDKLGKELSLSNKFDLFKLSKLDYTKLRKVAAQCTLAIGLAVKE
ncbi:MAG: type IV pilus assembly protein PilM, partial [bacterium]